MTVSYTHLDVYKRQVPCRPMATVNKTANNVLHRKCRFLFMYIPSFLSGSFPFVCLSQSSNVSLPLKPPLFPISSIFVENLCKWKANFHLWLDITAVHLNTGFAGVFHIKPVFSALLDRKGMADVTAPIDIKYLPVRKMCIRDRCWSSPDGHRRYRKSWLLWE